MAPVVQRVDAQTLSIGKKSPSPGQLFEVIIIHFIHWTATIQPYIIPDISL